MTARQAAEHPAPDPDAPAAPATSNLSTFGEEFRELARQRRFVREAERAAGSLAGVARPGTPGEDQRTESAEASANVRLRHDLPGMLGFAGDRAARPARRATADERISTDAAAMLAEMSRLADRVVESREALGAAVARADRAERELAGVNDRMMAARALVHEAQRAAAEANERSAWLEGRNEALHDALELAVNASPLKRWRWRRRANSQRQLVD